MPPYMRSIAKLFAKSPFKCLHAHAHAARDTVACLPKAFDAYFEGDEERVQELYEQIAMREHEVDEIKQKIREKLPASILMPVQRSDVLDLLRVQDSVADHAKLTSQLLTLRMIEVPQNIQEDFNLLLDQVIKTVEKHDEVVDEMTTLLDTGIGKKESKKMLEMIQEVDVLEDQADNTKFKLLKSLYNSDMSALDVHLLTEVVRALDNIANRAEDSAGRFRTMIARQD